MHARYSVALCFFLLVQAVTACAQTPNVDIDAAERKAVIEELGRQMRGQYVFSDVAAKVATALAAKNDQDKYKNIRTAPVFAEALSKDLFALTGDRHLGVDYAPNFKSSSGNGQPQPPGKELVAEVREATARDGFGIARVERLPGNVGYLDMRNFGYPEFVGTAYASAIDLLSGTDALILDLRQNDGGDASGVIYLLSLFFPVGDSRHLDDFYSRTGGSTQQYWTLPLPGIRYNQPVYVLTSTFTFSGAEECAYIFQAQKRATLVGEATRGGANMPSPVSLGHGFVAAIPTVRPINPITKTNWENVGVRPDIAVPAADAMNTAYIAILKTLIPKAWDNQARANLMATLARVEKGESEKPRYTAPQE